MPQKESESEYPGNAARDFYSGVMFGWVGMDVKADMDTCYPDNTDLAELIEENFEAWSSGDW